MRYLVTGGAGFIGSHLVEGLLARNFRVRVLDDFSTGNAANLEHLEARIELVRGSVTDPAAALRAVSGCDVVFHLAALPSVQKSVEEPQLVHEITATGTLTTHGAPIPTRRSMRTSATPVTANAPSMIMIRISSGAAADSVAQRPGRGARPSAMKPPPPSSTAKTTRRLASTIRTGHTLGSSSRISI